MKPGSGYRILMLLLVFACWMQAQQIHCLPLGDAPTAFELRLLSQGQIYDRAADKTIEWRQLVTRLALARIVVLGESHDNYHHHLQQARLIEELVQAGKKVVIGMEFFNVEQQPLLDRWSKGELNESKLLAASNWFNQVGFNYRYYRPILETARRHHLPLAGLEYPTPHCSQGFPARVDGAHGLKNGQCFPKSAPTTSSTVIYCSEFLANSR